MTKIEDIRKEMFADGVDKSTRAKLEKEYRSIGDDTWTLEKRRKKYFEASGHASFIWLYLRQAPDSDDVAQASSAI